MNGIPKRHLIGTLIVGAVMWVGIAVLAIRVVGALK